MARFVDLSHEIRDGMTTHPGIPAPRIGTFLTHEESATRYAEGTSFEIGRIDLVANTGTYVDTAAHRFRGAPDLRDLDLDRVANVPGRLLDRTGAVGAIDLDPAELDGAAVAAVLVWTGWDRHWGTEAYLSGNPFLTSASAAALVDAGVAVVGIDSLNVDSLVDGRRPAHTILLRAGVVLVEHLTGLDALPASGFRMFAVPPRIAGMATFPVRAFAIVDDATVDA
jgi:kynurenine formamidase